MVPMTRRYSCGADPGQLLPADRKGVLARDGLRSRYPIAIAMIVHSVMVVSRIPLAVAEMSQADDIPFRSPSST